MKRLSALSAVLMAFPAFAATPTTWTTTIDAATYGVTGTISFNDNGYVGPNGVGANDFKVGSGFDANRIGQIQTVVTKDPDGLTSDPRARVEGDLGVPNPDGLQYPRANMDGQVQFYKWAYTTVGGSTFKDMTIDKAGNYFVAKNDMAFQYYDVFKYHDVAGIRPDETRDTYLNFQPYAISDARGWCGSVLTSNPAALERMAGQVTFDFAFDAYLDGNANGSNNPDSFTGTQIIPGFVMRSYGSYTMTVNGITFNGSAVENNTNPLTGQLDPAWQNQVSFLGGGVVPLGAWVLNDGTADVTVVAEGTPGATWHSNAFAGYSFLLRADGTRMLTFVAPNFSDYTATPVPEPEAVWMFAVGVGMLGAVAWCRKTA